MTDQDSYDAGHLAGGIDARLAGHDKHFARINGSMEDVAKHLAGLTLAVQRLADAADADRHTVVTTAAALKTADEARRSTDVERWSPWQKLIAAIGGAAALAGLLTLILTRVS